MQLTCTLAQWEPVVAAVDPRHHATMLYEPSAGFVGKAGLVELGLATNFSPPPLESDFLAAFPDSIAVQDISA